jgi:hypothetical protein
MYTQHMHPDIKNLHLECRWDKYQNNLKALFLGGGGGDHSVCLHLMRYDCRGV